MVFHYEAWCTVDYRQIVSENGSSYIYRDTSLMSGFIVNKKKRNNSGELGQCYRW